jgi:HK97 family phage prohead protease
MAERPRMEWDEEHQMYVAETRADDPKKPYGNVDYADPEEGKYPIDTAEHCKAAWSFVNEAKNAAILGDKLGAVKARIEAACKKFGIDVSDNSAGRSMLDDNTERRLTFVRVEVRSVDGVPSRTIGGYAAVFNSMSRRLPFGFERVAPGFFTEDRTAGWPGNGAGVVARYNHNDDFLLGTTQAGTLRLKVDQTGLDYSVDLPECRSDTLEMVGRGDVAASSFAFAVDEGGDEWRHNDAGVTERTLITGKLIDVAPVGGALAAYPNATVALRSLARQMHASLEEVERLAAEDELRRLFKRTDIALPTPPPIEEVPQQLNLELDVGPDVEPRGMSHYDATLRLHELRYPPTVPTTAEMAETERKVRL